MSEPLCDSNEVCLTYSLLELQVLLGLFCNQKQYYDRSESDYPRKTSSLWAVAWESSLYLQHLQNFLKNLTKRTASSSKSTQIINAEVDVPKKESSYTVGLQPTRLLCPWDFPNKSSGVGCHCLLWENSIEVP